MKTTLYIFAAIALLFSVNNSAGDFSIASAAKKSKESVVLISVFSSKIENGLTKYVKTGYGSGTIISSTGYIVTNYHVVKKGDFYMATLSDGTDVEFEKLDSSDFYKFDDETDLAIMKLFPGRYIPIDLADPSSVKEGDTVIAVGNPYGLRHSITGGIISSIGRCDIGFSLLEDFIQTDVPINPGNSGGPLVNINGQMIGINSAIRTSDGAFQGISFAIPSYIVKNVSEDLLKYGKVIRPWLGIAVKEEFIADRKLLRIVSVSSKSPAHNSGLKKGDIIKEADGVLISSKGALLRIIKNKKIDSDLYLTVSRNGILRDFRIFFSQSNISSLNKIILKKYGISVHNDEEGNPVVCDIRSDGNISGISPGDTIIAVDGQTTPDMKTFIIKLKKNLYHIKSLEIKRDKTHYIFEFEK